MYQMSSAQIFAEAADWAGTSQSAQRDLQYYQWRHLPLAAYVAEDREDVRHGLYRSDPLLHRRDEDTQRARGLNWREAHAQITQMR